MLRLFQHSSCSKHVFTCQHCHRLRTFCRLRPSPFHVSSPLPLPHPPSSRAPLPAPALSLASCTPCPEQQGSTSGPTPPAELGPQPWPWTRTRGMGRAPLGPQTPALPPWPSLPLDYPGPPVVGHWTEVVRHWTGGRTTTLPLPRCVGSLSTLSMSSRTRLGWELGWSKGVGGHPLLGLAWEFCRLQAPIPAHCAASEVHLIRNAPS